MAQLVFRVEYDGSRFFGFQFQPGVPTVQSAIETTLTGILKRHVRVRGAGRTDRGVHALGQVVAIAEPPGVPPERLLTIANAHLAPYVTFRSVEVRPDRFCPRRDAVLRHYRYVALARPEPPPPMLAAYVGLLPGRIDWSLAATAARVLEGSHRFVSFCKKPGEQRRLERSIDRIGVTPAGRYVAVDLWAPSFLRGQVRTIIAWMAQVGRGLADANTIVQLLEAPEKQRAIPPAPPGGLYLMRVFYPGEPLPAGIAPGRVAPGATDE